jgi:hypothetical protein
MALPCVCLVHISSFLRYVSRISHALVFYRERYHNFDVTTSISITIRCRCSFVLEGVLSLAINSVIMVDTTLA